ILDTDTLVPFLEHQLAMIGLNDYESTDFITFWAPRMLKYDNVAIQFIIDEEYNQKIADLEVVPSTQSQKRVFMLFKGIDADNNLKNVANPVFQKFERSGLTLVEWGGSELK